MYQCHFLSLAFVGMPLANVLHDSLLASHSYHANLSTNNTGNKRKNALTDKKKKRITIVCYNYSLGEIETMPRGMSEERSCNSKTSAYKFDISSTTSLADTV